ncbi:MAG: hypothetical protein R3Y09_07840 [Clostridia bacterium]
MDNKMSFEDFIGFVYVLLKFVQADQSNKEIATKTMQRVAINNNFEPIYLW